jgi:protein involved in temperature-dependent protein secretion
MFLSHFALAATACIPSAQVAAATSAEVDWFAGSVEEALGEAQRAERILLVGFCDPFSDWCGRLERQTYAHPPAIELMRRFVCLKIDTDTADGTALGKRFHVSTLPTILFLEPDGAVRDVLRGFVPPEPFRDELARILSGEDSITRLRERVGKEPQDLDARYELARKLSKVGDAHGVQEQIEAIRRLDPEGRSRASRRIAMDEAAQAVRSMQPPSDARFRELLEGETEPDLLYLGWSWVYRVDRAIAESQSEADERASYAKRAREACPQAWPHCPPAERPLFGNEIAWWFYEHADELTPDEKRFALGVAREVTLLQPADANLRDTYAGCLSINGRTEEALAQLKRCIELEPDNPQWKARLAELGGE